MLRQLTRRGLGNYGRGRVFWNSSPEYQTNLWNRQLTREVEIVIPRQSKVPTIPSVRPQDRQLLLPVYKATKSDRVVSSTIIRTTNILRDFSMTSSSILDIGVRAVCNVLLEIQDFNQRVLPKEIMNPTFAPVIHEGVIILKHGTVYVNWAFDSLVKGVIYVGKEFGKLFGKSVISGFRLAQKSARLNPTKETLLPKTQDSIVYFFTVSVDEGFAIIEAVDRSLTSLFAGVTDTTLQTVEHVFGEGVKDISRDLSITSRNSFEFYKKVKLFKIKSVQRKVVKATGREIIQTMSSELKK